MSHFLIQTVFGTNTTFVYASKNKEDSDTKLRELAIEWVNQKYGNITSYVDTFESELPQNKEGFFVKYEDRQAKNRIGAYHVKLAAAAGYIYNAVYNINKEGEFILYETNFPLFTSTEYDDVVRKYDSIVSDYQSTLSDKDKTISILEERQKKSVAEYDEIINDYRNIIKQNEVKMSVVENTLLERSKRITELHDTENAVLSAQEKQIEMLTASLNEKYGTISQLEDEIVAFKRNFEDFRAKCGAERQNFTATIENYKSRIEGLQHALANLQAEFNNLSGHFDNLNDRLIISNKNLTDTEFKLDIKEQANAHLKTILNDLTSKLNKAQSDSDDKSVKYANKIAELNAIIEDQQETLEEQASMIDEKVKNIELLNSQVESLTTSTATVTHDLNVANEILAAFKDQISTLKEQVEIYKLLKSTVDPSFREILQSQSENYPLFRTDSLRETYPLLPRGKLTKKESSEYNKVINELKAVFSREPHLPPPPPPPVEKKNVAVSKLPVLDLLSGPSSHVYSENSSDHELFAKGDPLINSNIELDHLLEELNAVIGK
jgi:uncharacterized phage infection (PIP) family protein YhgE